MAKKIKKQIKRSMPLFVIVTLLCANVALGLVFDLDVSISKIDNGINVTITTNDQVIAQTTDRATTTVTVRNNPPTITVAPAETPLSASTTPTNMWSNLSFTVTANDDEDNDYYLLICSTAAATPDPGGLTPSCDATQFCVSASTTDETQATCTYTNVQDPGAESQEWYAIVCDDHPDESECNVAGASQGAGESGSPFWVNHPPYFTAVNTVVDNLDPDGSSYTVGASSTDPDIASSADRMILDVCLTNDWATSTGCGGITLCTATSTSPDVYCSFATTSPAIDGTFTYYAFVRDEHFLAATTTQNNSYTVNNVAPQVSDVDLTNGLDIYLNFKGESGVNATTSATISDLNGCFDIDHATGSIYWSGATGAYNCSPDDNDCYQIAQVDCTVSEACTDYTDTDMVYTCSTTIAFHAIPTDGDGTSNPNYWDTWWEGAVRGFDEALSGVASSTVDQVDVILATALDVQEVEIPYGSIRGGQDTAAYNATTTVDNYGNTPINTDFTGDDMTRTGGGYIGVNNQRYSTTTFTYSVGPYWTLSSSSPQWVERDLDLAKPTTTSFTVSDSVYWGIGIPAGKLSGVYEGTNYFRSALDEADW